MNPRRIVLLFLVIAAGHVLAESGDKKATTAKQKEAKQPAASVSASKAESKEEFVPGGVAHSFVIPKNTCESGTPLQKLLTNKPPTDKPK